MATIGAAPNRHPRAPRPHSRADFADLRQELLMAGMSADTKTRGLALLLHLPCSHDCLNFLAQPVPAHWLTADELDG